MVEIQLLHSRSDPEYMTYYLLVFPLPNMHLLNSIANSGNLEYRSAVYPCLVPELQNWLEYCSLKEKNISSAEHLG